ncbi:hypothetical protein SAICODRAFT_22400 [Saitoella complicata NRRL Y-17804]|uniref:Nucleolar pre-ribosomal-associated protein 1 n=1 Tax=Saitoella complicata (strain BCRC 22490 / CBS 7301 / JCM 7358 / NBRC 10748 / NRRL Y-17804) TaxID=698492 RepID=A0A0E9NPC0_SAICN|nr:uncharacterized protein SAICODRAFT_22400 [Saitoella complicata NRRL Y-17804]ODQ55962.1 hypothetical protein SAICODRAFT_22400 [Saitoella complicata NRRL Y-17804]GAO51516.1 hypothetical protein G7K_5615-t1 [Saitoella complicata NRRL Y-17804]
MAKTPNGLPKRGVSNNQGPAEITVESLQLHLKPNNSPQFISKGLHQLRQVAQSAASQTSSKGQANLQVLTAYLEASEGLKDVFTIWTNAQQYAHQALYSLCPLAVTAILKAFSKVASTQSHGTAIIREVIATHMKSIYRNITSNRPALMVPTLKLLTEMSGYGGGILIVEVYGAFDLGLKSLSKLLNMRKADTEDKDERQHSTSEEDEPSRKRKRTDQERPKRAPADVRTMFTRLLLAYLRLTPKSIKTEVLAQRTIMSALFKGLYMDEPELVRDVLECFATNVVLDKEVPKNIKVGFFNEWMLGQVVQLYGRVEGVQNADGSVTTVPDMAHQFLMLLCTKPGVGVCFEDAGWYTPSLASDSTTSGKRVLKLHNKILSGFVLSLRPSDDVLQQDLLLEMFRVCPELVAHWTLNTMISFEPKLSSGWIAGASLLAAIVDLPIPQTGTGVEEGLLPDLGRVVENVLPAPLTKAVLTKALGHESSLVRCFAARMLTGSLRKLQRVMVYYNERFSGSKGWRDFEYELVETVSRRVPDVQTVLQMLKTTSGSGSASLLMESVLRLFAAYLEVLPDFALATKMDVGINAVREMLNEERSTPLYVVQQLHALNVLSRVPDLKWWSKSGSSQSIFALLIKIYLGIPHEQVKDLIAGILRQLVGATMVFQTMTVMQPLDALLETLAKVKDGKGKDAVVAYVEDCVARCMQKPYQYLDEAAKLTVEALKSAESKAQEGALAKLVRRDKERGVCTSPLVVTLFDQFGFLRKNEGVKSEEKGAVSGFVATYVQKLVLLGENVDVAMVLCERTLGGDEWTGVFETALKGLKEVGVKESPTNGAGAQDSEDLGMLQAIIAKTTVYGGDVKPAFTSLARRLHALRAYPAKFKEAKTALVSDHYFSELFLSTAAPGSPAFSTELVDVLKEFYSESDREVLQSLFATMERLAGSVWSGETVVYGAEQMRYILSATTHIWTTKQRAGLLKLAVARIDATAVEDAHLEFAGTLLQFNDYSKTVSASEVNVLVKFAGQGSASYISALAEYYVSWSAAASSDALQQIEVPGDLLTALDESKTALVKALLRGRKDKHEELSTSITQNGMDATNKHLLAVFETVLDDASVNTNESAVRYSWVESISPALKAALEKVVRASVDHLFDAFLAGNTDEQDCHVLCKAIDLSPSLDRVEKIKLVLGQDRPSLLTASFVKVLRALREGVIERDVRSSLAGWYNTVAKRLTRRFAEDDVLSDEVLDFLTEMDIFLRGTKVPFASTIHRGLLDPVVEAGLRNHITVLPVMKFLTTVVFDASLDMLTVTRASAIVLNNARSPLSVSGTGQEQAIEEALKQETALLLHRLFVLDPLRLYNAAVVDNLLRMYKGSTSFMDMLILDILMGYEQEQAQSITARFGEWVVTELESETFTDGATQTAPRVVICEETALRSILNFPIQIDRPSKDNMQSRADCERFVEKSRQQTSEIIYDPLFMLPVIASYMRKAEQSLELRRLVESHAYGYVVAALSSSEASVRSMALHILADFDGRLDDAMIRERHQLKVLLSSLKNALPEVEDEPVQLASVVAVFLALSVQIVANPGHFLYEKLNRFLLQRPALDLDDIPMFYTLMNSADNYQKEVNWLLRVLVAGLKTSKDFYLYRRRHVIELCLGLYRSSVITQVTKTRVLELLWTAAGIPGVNTSLVTKFGALGWLQQHEAFEDETQESSQDLMWSRLGTRLVVASDKDQLSRWSRIGVRSILQAFEPTII